MALSPEQEQAQRIAREEAIMVAELAGNVAGHMKQIGGMSAGGTNPSKAQVIDPRKFLRGMPGAGTNPAPGNASDDPLKPRLNMIPLPKGVSMNEVLDPLIPGRVKPPGQPVASSVPAATDPTSPQLELDFNHQASLNEIYDRLDTLQSILNKLVSIVEQQKAHANTADDSGKKKSIPPLPADQ